MECEQPETAQEKGKMYLEEVSGGFTIQLLIKGTTCNMLSVVVVVDLFDYSSTEIIFPA